jgi:hypothetical protein
LNEVVVANSAPDDPLEHVAWLLSNSWPHYWQTRAKTREQLRERHAATERLPEGPLALQLSTLGLRLLVEARRGLAASEPDFAATGAAALLMGMAEEYYLYLGILPLIDDPTLFDQYVASAPPRPQTEAFVRDVGVADWCADAGYALLDAAGAEIRLAPDHVPAPTIETPRYVSVISRMRPDLTAPGDARARTFQAVASALRHAIATYRDHLLPAVREKRRYIPASKPDSALMTQALLICRNAIGQTMQTAAQNEDADADMAAITALRFLAQDMILANTRPPARYDELPFLTTDEFNDIADPDSDIQAWITAHTPHR